MDHRKKTVNLFIKILGEYKKIDDKDIKSLAGCIEISCFSAATETAEKKNISKRWDNTFFMEIYQIITSRVAINMDIESDVKYNTLPERIINTANFNSVKKILIDLFGVKLAKKICENYKLIKISKIGFMDSDELNPLSNLDEQKIIKLRNEQHVNAKISTMYTCPRCSRKESKIYRWQTRSSDEGYTFIIECQACGHRKISYG
jgi:DNA-directed RNA polymerase subunit M/transcription elongation factor TFIIS